MKGTLFPRLAFSPDETHVSWAGRLAAFHAGDGVDLFLRDLRIPRVAFNRGYPEFVRILCTIADQDPEPVLRNTILRTNPYWYSLNTETFGSRVLVGQSTRFCPKCLLEDDAKGGRPHAERREHLAWCLAAVHVCPTHNIFLMTDNVTSARPTDLSSRVQLCTKGLQILSDYSETAIPSPLQAYLLSRISGEKGPDWLDGQAIDQAAGATEMLGAVLEFGYRADIDNMSIEDWHRAACVGWEYTSSGEPGVQTAFRLIKADTPTVTHVENRRPGYRFGRLYHWLALKTSYDDRGPIRDLLRKHIVATEPVTTERKILGVMVRRNRIEHPKRLKPARR